jgi:cytoskeletal protein RodZ
MLGLWLALNVVATVAQDTPSSDPSTSTTSAKKKKSKKDASAQDQSSASTSASTAATTTAPAKTAAPAKTSKMAAASAPAASDPQISSAKSQGMVWVNMDSGVYHKGGRWYGKTKNGKFMSEGDAKKAGYKDSQKD